MVEGASAAPPAQALHAPSTAQTRGPPPPLRFTTRGRISERVPATRSAPGSCENVGWVSCERSVTHHAAAVGFASLYPPYETTKRKKKGSGTPTDVFSQPPRLTGAARTSGCARLSTFHYGSHPSGLVSPRAQLQARLPGTRQDVRSDTPAPTGERRPCVLTRALPAPACPSPGNAPPGPVVVPVR